MMTVASSRHFDRLGVAFIILMLAVAVLVPVLALAIPPELAASPFRPMSSR